MRTAKATAELLDLVAPAPAGVAWWPAEGLTPPSPLFKQVPPALQRRRDDNWLAANVGRVRPDPFAILFERHWRSVGALCLSILGTRDEADDAAQEAMTRAYAVLSARREQPDFKPWIHAIARNAALDRIRQRTRGAELGLTDEDLAGEHAEDPGEVLGRREQLRGVIADLRLLSERQRTALVLRELSGMSHEEIAKALDTTPARSKSLVSEARETLAKRRDGQQISCGDYRSALSRLGRLPRGHRLSVHRDSCSDCRGAARPRILGALVAPFFWRPGGADAYAGGLAAKAAAISPLTGKLVAGIAAATVAAGGTGIAIQELERPAPSAAPAAGSVADREAPAASSAASKAAKIGTRAHATSLPAAAIARGQAAVAGLEVAGAARADATGTALALLRGLAPSALSDLGERLGAAGRSAQAPHVSSLAERGSAAVRVLERRLPDAGRVRAPVGGRPAAGGRKRTARVREPETSRHDPVTTAPPELPAARVQETVESVVDRGEGLLP